MQFLLFCKMYISIAQSCTILCNATLVLASILGLGRVYALMFADRGASVVGENFVC